MEKLRQLVARLQQGSNLQVIMGLGLAIVTLLLLAIIGAFAVGDDADDVATRDSTDLEAGETTDTTFSVTDPSLVPTESTVPGAAPAPGVTSRRGGPAPAAAKKTVGGSGVTKDDLVSEAGATRVGVTEKTIRWGVHAPITFDGKPLELAKDPVEGVRVYTNYLNEKDGGVHGRKIDYKIFDDRYTVEGAKGAANELNAFKPFHIGGTLGVDQVAIVAAEAKKSGTPYLAGGGSESLFKNIGLFQNLASYDTALIRLAEYLRVESKKAGSPYQGRTKVGVSELDSAYIGPSVDSFKDALEKPATGNQAKLTLVARAKVKKFTDPSQTGNYQAQINQLKSSGAEIVVPVQDPLTTAQEVAQCVGCTWKWAFANFAHESDTAIKLMGGKWIGVRGLGGGCYYKHPNAFNPAHCGAMKSAHEQWVAMKGESNWNEQGNGGSAGYQFVHIWLKAIRDAGPDLTREKFLASLRSYENYNDLVTSPITYKGSSNLAHGAEKFVVLEGGASNWTQITPGFVDQF